MPEMMKKRDWPMTLADATSSLSYTSLAINPLDGFKMTFFYSH